MGDSVHTIPATPGMSAPASRHKLESRIVAKVRSVVASIRNAPDFGEKFLFETVDLKDRPRADGVAEFAFATHPTCNGDT